MAEHLEICLERVTVEGAVAWREILERDWGKPAELDVENHWLFEEATIGHYRFRKTLLAILPGSEGMDVELTFDASAVPEADAKSAIDVLINSVRRWAEIAGAEDWYCGMEPCSDTKTRYFTRTEPGPLLSILGAGGGEKKQGIA